MPAVQPGTILGHEAVGTIVETGSAVTTLEVGDRVLVSCITSCGRCRFCKEGHYGLCTGGGGWIFGHLIDGLQAEYARVPFADTSVYKVPAELDRRAGALPRRHPSDRVRGRRPQRRASSPGDTVAIVGAGPIGLAAVMTAKLYTPGHIVAIDLADARLEQAREFGADVTINNGDEDALAQVMELTGGLGADVAIEAVGVPETFELCTELVRPGGRVANVGVHGQSGDAAPRDALDPGRHDHDGARRHVHDAAAARADREGRLNTTPFATHRFALDETMRRTTCSPQRRDERPQGRARGGLHRRRA